MKSSIYRMFGNHKPKTTLFSSLNQLLSHKYGKGEECCFKCGTEDDVHSCWNCDVYLCIDCDPYEMRTDLDDHTYCADCNPKWEPCEKYFDSKETK